jgi:hypothetical protein
MRISIDKKDPGYLPWRKIRYAEVYFNWRKIEKCITADEEEGIIIVNVRDESDKLQRGADGRLQRETLHGDVRIDLPYDRSDHRSMFSPWHRRPVNP